MKHAARLQGRMAGSKSMRLYLDSCCFNRPFDDLRQERVRIEADAVTAILGRIQAGLWQLITGEVLEFELGRMPGAERRESCLALMRDSSGYVPADSVTRSAADELEDMGFDALDAAHLASARRGGAEVFLTVDDKLLRKARTLEKELGVRVESPLT